jgi:hypothetical protein
VRHVRRFWVGASINSHIRPSVFEGIAAGADWANPAKNPEEID